MGLRPRWASPCRRRGRRDVGARARRAAARRRALTFSTGGWGRCRACGYEEPATDRGSVQDFIQETRQYWPDEATTGWAEQHHPACSAPRSNTGRTGWDRLLIRRSDGQHEPAARLPDKRSPNVDCQCRAVLGKHRAVPAPAARDWPDPEAGRTPDFGVPLPSAILEALGRHPDRFLTAPPRERSR
jgi:hypothetical protein